MKEIRICDTHNDFLTELSLGENSAYIQKCKNFGVEKICASYWSSRREEGKIEKELLERTDILRRGGGVALLHIEDLWWVKDEKSLEFLLRLKPFSCSLTWNGENILAGGVGSDSCLSEWGRYCLKRLVEAGVVVDVAHLNRKSFWQVAKTLKKNIYCSHTGFCGVKNHPRNLIDKQIDFVVRSGGFVGLFFFDDCIKKNPESIFDVDDVVTNLKYFTSRWGLDNIGIGTDFYGIENYPLGLESYEGFANLYDAMEKSGFSDEQIDKIFCKNFEDFVARL